MRKSSDFADFRVNLHNPPLFVTTYLRNNRFLLLETNQTRNVWLSYWTNKQRTLDLYCMNLKYHDQLHQTYPRFLVLPYLNFLTNSAEFIIPSTLRFLWFWNWKSPTYLSLIDHMILSRILISLSYDRLVIKSTPLEKDFIILFIHYINEDERTLFYHTTFITRYSNIHKILFFYH